MYIVLCKSWDAICKSFKRPAGPWRFQSKSGLINIQAQYSICGGIWGHYWLDTSTGEFWRPRKFGSFPFQSVGPTLRRMWISMDFGVSQVKSGSGCQGNFKGPERPDWRVETRPHLRMSASWRKNVRFILAKTYCTRSAYCRKCIMYCTSAVYSIFRTLFERLFPVIHPRRMTWWFEVSSNFFSMGSRWGFGKITLYLQVHYLLCVQKMPVASFIAVIQFEGSMIKGVWVHKPSSFNNIETQCYFKLLRYL